MRGGEEVHRLEGLTLALSLALTLALNLTLTLTRCIASRALELHPDNPRATP